MNSRDFCYWLQGVLEVSNVKDTGMTPGQVDMIQAHLALVFTHEIDPSFGDADHQKKLNDIHKPQIGGVDAKGNKMRC